MQPLLNTAGAVFNLWRDYVKNSWRFYTFGFIYPCDARENNLIRRDKLARKVWIGPNKSL